MENRNNFRIASWDIFPIAHTLTGNKNVKTAGIYTHVMKWAQAVSSVRLTDWGQRVREETRP